MKATAIAVSQREKEVVTQSAQIWKIIRSDILVGELLLGLRLRMEELRRRYGVGASPLREALMRLEAEGLVLLQQNRGFKFCRRLWNICAMSALRGVRLNVWLFVGQLSVATLSGNRTSLRHSIVYLVRLSLQAVATDCTVLGLRRIAISMRL